MNWWVVNNTPPGGPVSYNVVQSASRPSNYVAGPFGNQQSAVAWLVFNKSPDQSFGGAVSHVASSIPNPLTGINAIGDFFSRLSQGSTWTRVAEFLGGGLLLYIGVKSLTTEGGQKVARASLRKNLGKLAGKTPAGRTAKALGKARP